MRSYELTERGKIAIAVLVALILLALALILAVKTFAKQDSDSPDNQNPAAFETSSSPYGDISAETPPETPPGTPPDEPAETPPETPPGTPPDIPTETPPGTLQTTANSPPPNGGDFTPPEVTLPTVSSDSGEDSSPNETDEIETPGGQDNTEPLDARPTWGNPSEGTLSFLFSPGYQSELDSDTASLLGVLLNSQNNTRNSMIAVATSRLSDSASSTLMAAIVRAFGVYGISEQRILHIENSTGVAAETFEVSLYFIPSSGK